MGPINDGNGIPISKPDTISYRADSMKFESAFSDERQADAFPSSKSSSMGRMRKTNWEHPRLKDALFQQYQAGPPNNKQRLLINVMALVLLRLFMKSRMGS
jgi:hypothetical protein